MILMRQEVSGGKRARTCSARCYNAKGSTCACICGGGNHSLGLEKGMENSAKVAQRIVQEAKVRPIEVLMI